MGRIWLIGGTQESAMLARLLADAQLPVTISVTSESARSLYPSAADLRVWVGRLNGQQMADFLKTEEIIGILDASHPYAIEISHNAIAYARNRQIPYLRYERPEIHTNFSDSLITYLPNFDTLICGDYLDSQRVLLTIGYQRLHLFSLAQERSTLFARLLPSVVALQAAVDAGFTQNRIICLRPPITYELEKALWQQWQISVVVTKASGSAGGENIKHQVAQDLGIPLLVITRPDIIYPQQTSDAVQALEFCHQALKINQD